MARITVLNESSNLEVALVLDVIEQETYTAEAEVTRHPVERGASVGDHVRPEPRPLEWSGSLSETPLDGTGRERDRLKRALEVLEQLRTSEDLYTVTTATAVYTSMHLVSYSARHSTALHGALDVTVRFEEVRVVQARTVRVKLPKRGPKPVSKDGKQTTTAASAEAKRKSIAARLVDGDFNLFGSK